MSDHGSEKPGILLLGLEPAIAEELSERLTAMGMPWLLIDRALDCAQLLSRAGVSLVFCPADPQRYLPVLQAARLGAVPLPVVVVSARPEVHGWLDAIEAGAADYCSTPFETSQIRWLLDTNLRRQVQAAA